MYEGSKVCASISVASAIVATVLGPFGTLTRLSIVKSAFEDGAFHPHTRSAVEYPAFVLPVVAAFASAALAMTSDRSADGARHALIAFAVYGVTGGTVLLDAILGAIIAFAAGMWSDRLLLGVSLAATLFDGAVSVGPQSAPRALLAVTHAGYALLAEEAPQPKLRPAWSAAWNVSVLWQAWAIVRGLAGPSPTSWGVSAAAAIVPAALAAAYTWTEVRRGGAVPLGARDAGAKALAEQDAARKRKKLKGDSRTGARPVFHV